MGALHVPSKDSIRGKILSTLKARQSVGASCDELMGVVRADKQVRVQAGIHELRNMGYRIDYDGKHYVYRGAGISHTVMNGKQMAVGSIKLRRQLERSVNGAGIQKSMDRLRDAAGYHPVQKSRPLAGMVLPKAAPTQGIRIPLKVVASKVFSVDADQLSQALKVVPEGLREELSAMASKMERFNAAIELCVKADASLKAILADK